MYAGKVYKFEITISEGRSTTLFGMITILGKYGPGSLPGVVTMETKEVVR